MRGSNYFRQGSALKNISPSLLCIDVSLRAGPANQSSKGILPKRFTRWHRPVNSHDRSVYHLGPVTLTDLTEGVGRGHGYPDPRDGARRESRGHSRVLYWIQERYARSCGMDDQNHQSNPQNAAALGRKRPAAHWSQFFRSDNRGWPGVHGPPDGRQRSCSVWQHFSPIDLNHQSKKKPLPRLRRACIHVI